MTDANSMDVKQHQRNNVRAFVTTPVVAILTNTALLPISMVKIAAFIKEENQILQEVPTWIFSCVLNQVGY